MNINGNSQLKNNYWSSEGVTFIQDATIYDSTSMSQLSSAEYGAKVYSVANLGINTVIMIGNYTREYIITKIFYIDQIPVIGFRQFDTTKGIGLPVPLGSLTEDNLVIRAFWVPIAPAGNENDLIEVGGSNVFVGFETGSIGTFWANARGDDRIEINCPGLELQAEASSKFTAVNVESTKIYGNHDESIPDNRFIQKNLIEFVVRNYLKWKAQPKLSFEIQNFVEGLNRSGFAQSLPISKIVNTTDKKLYTVRIRSKKYLPNCKDNIADGYLMEYNINSNFSQNLKVRIIEPY